MIYKYPRTTGALIGGVLAGAVALISPWEGYFGRTYKDIVGVPTVCYGETDKVAVAEGRKREFTKPECLDMLAKRLPEYDAGFMRCVKRPIPDSVHIAGISLAYNVGVGGACRSTFVRKINSGKFVGTCSTPEALEENTNDCRGACDALLSWNRAGGRVVKGLDNRRHAERIVCLQGLPT